MNKSERPNPEPLKITCTSSDCENNLHCFKKSRKMSESEKGRCRSCGADLINWERIHSRDINDTEFTFISLKYEMFRHSFWHKQIDIKTMNHARRKGRAGLKTDAIKRLIKYIAPTNNPYDGRQTPYKGNIIFYAQHAIACCCRKCLEYWHGIPVDTPLSEDQIDYFVELIMMYIVERIPELTELGEKIPPIRARRS